MKPAPHLTATLAATLVAGFVAPAYADAPPAWPPVSSHDGPQLPGAHEAKPVTPHVKHVRLVRVRGGAHHLSGHRYRVRSGDTLWAIARAFLGSGRRWRTVFRVNRDRIQDPNLIYPGQLLRVPRRGEKRSRHHRHHVHAAAPHATSAIHKAASEPTPAPKQAPTHKVSVKPAVKKAIAKKLATTVAHAEAHAANEPPSFAGDSFQGHRRIGGHFYALRTSKLVWADDGALVIGDSEANGGAEAVRPVSAATVTAIDAAGSDAEPTIQGHRRVNGSFYSRKGKTLIWADTGEPVRARK